MLQFLLLTESGNKSEKTLNSRIALQTIALFGSQIFIILIGIAVKSIQTNALGKDDYGTYAFLISITTFTALFLRLGFFSSLQVILPGIKDSDKRNQFIGSGFLIILGLGFLLSLFVFFFSFIVDDLFDSNVGKYLFYFAPLCFVIPFRHYLMMVATGINKFQSLINFDLISKSLYIVLLFILWKSSNLDLWSVIFFNLFTTLIGFIIVFPSLKPSFKHIKSRVDIIWEKNKSYGFHFYLGNAANLSTYRIDEFLIVAYIDTTHLGYYTLACAICSPMALMSQSLSNALFKRFASEDRIPKEVILLNTLWLIACIIGIYFIGSFVVEILFGKDFSKIATYLLPLSFAYFFQGMYQPYSFLTAKEMGKEIRNVAFIEATFNIFGNFILIPLFGVFGAIISSIIAKFVHWIGKIFYYRKYLKTING